MVRTFHFAAALVAGVALSTAAFAQLATPDEVRTLLAKAAGALVADKAKGLEIVNSGEHGFLDIGKDLYVFCADVSDGKLVAIGNPDVKKLLGIDTRTLKGGDGDAFGQKFFEAGQKPEGVFSEVNFLFPKPGADKTPVPKTMLITRAGDVYCGSGYYK